MSSKCIICRNENVQFSDKHVFPESIGGVYHIYTVCHDCNKILGNKVDIKLVDHILIRMFREQYKLAGKTGDIPCFLDTVKHDKNDPLQRIRLFQDNSGNIKLKQLPKIEKSKLADGSENISITVDSTDKELIPELLDKYKKRFAKEGKKIVFGEPISSTQHGMEISGDLVIDVAYFRTGLLKIAYEFACDVIPAYIDDDNAKSISIILHNADYENVSKYVKYGNGFQSEMLEPYENIFGSHINKHVIYLLNIESKLICFISLFNTVCVGVQLSNKEYFQNQIYICYNDYIEKKVKKILIDENLMKFI